MVTILGVEFDFDFYEADSLELYEQENERVSIDIKEPTQYEGKRTSESIRIQCGIIDKFFDNMFGEGTAQKLFNGRANLRIHMEAFAQMADAAHESRRELDAIEDKYSPNRAERRKIEQQNRQTNKQNSRNYQHNAAHNGRNRH